MKTLEELKQKFPMIGEDIIAGICRYVNDGCRPGGFLCAVLTNNLSNSFVRADDKNQQIIFDIVRLCIWEIPNNCWGSVEKVKAWIDRND